MARLRTVVLAAGAAVVVRRALRTRIRRSPLWPLPALEEPVSGRPRSRATTLRVVRRDTPADGVVRLRLEGTGELPAWEPGAHLDLVLPSGTVRQYSLCGDPADRSAYTVATRLIEAAEGGRGGSLELHRELREGTEVTVRGPRNRFPLTAAPAYVFVAGGIGITPLLPMVRAAQAAGADWKLLYGGRTRASMPFADELEKLGGPRAGHPGRRGRERPARPGGGAGRHPRGHHRLLLRPRGADGGGRGGPARGLPPAHRTLRRRPGRDAPRPPAATSPSRSNCAAPAAR